MNSHPRFNEDKKEETSRLAREVNLDGYESTPKKQATLALELEKELEEDAEDESRVVKAKVMKRKSVPKVNPIKRKLKFRAHRHVSPEQDQQVKKYNRLLITC